jgi:Na+/proline symporter
MQYLGIDYLIVYAFLAVTLAIGLRAGRGIKDIREYAIANKTFGTGALVLTLLATNIAGASVINTSSRVFSSGIIMSVALLGVSIGFALLGTFIIPKVARFDRCLTMGDLAKEFYGHHSGIIAGMLGLLNAILLVGMELRVLGIVCEGLLHIPAKWGIILGGFLLAIYSAHGGIKAVTATDVFQFIMLAIFIPLIAYKAVGKIGGIKALLQQVPAEKLEIFGHKDFSFYLTLFLMWIIPTGILEDPALTQRLFMAKNGTQLRNQYLIVAAFDPTFRILIMLIGLSAYVLYPTIEGKQVIPHLIHNLLPVGVQGLAIAGVLAVGMSTIDSYLHAAGLTLVHDVVRPFYEQKNKSINEIRWTKYATVLLAGIGIYIGLHNTDILGLAFTALELTSPLLMIPLVSGIVGLKTDKKDFYRALIVTIAAFIIAKLALPENKEHFSALITMSVNGIAFFGSHYIRHQGFLIIHTTEGKESIWKPRRKVFIDRLKSILPIPQNIIAYSQAKVDRYGAPYILFGIFCIINYTVPFFIWMEAPTQYENLLIYLRVIGGILCVLLIAQEKWPPYLQPYLPAFWHLTVLYCLPFTNTLMFLLTDFNTEWLMGILGIIILLFVILDWATAVMLGMLGVGLALLVYKLLAGTFVLPISFHAKYLMVYQGLFGIIIGLIFARRKQLAFNKVATDNQILAATEQEIRQSYLETVIEKICLIKTLKNADIQKLSTAVKELRSMKGQVKKSPASVDSLYKNLQEVESAVASVALALTRVDHRAIDYLRLEAKPIAIEQLLEQLQQQLPNTTFHYIWKTKYQQIVADPIQLVKLLKNTIVTLPDKEDLQQKDYYLTIQDTRLTYPLRTVSPNGDYIKDLSAIRLIVSRQTNHLPDLAANYTPEMSSFNLPNPSDGRELLLTENQRIIKAHYGYTNIDISKQTTYDHYLYVVPVDVTEIRPADMNAPDKELGVELVRANDQYPGAQEQEREFLTAVREKSPANIENVKEALELIKWYHGSVSRKSGEPYYLHPLAVARIVLDWNQEEATIIGALLHDTVEDTPMLLENIDMMFGPDVVRVVDYVTHFESFKDSFYRGKLNDTENKRMLLEATDKRALYVKVADRLHNMRTIESHQTEEKKRKICQETLDFFVPLAKYLGLEQGAKELLDRSTRVLNR